MSRIRLYSWLIDPTRVITFVFMIQFVLWAICMPSHPTIYGVAQRYWSLKSAVTYIYTLIFLYLGMIVGKGVAVSRIKTRGIGSFHSRVTLDSVLRMAQIALVLSALGEIVYIHSVFNVQLFHRAFSGAGLGVVGEVAHESRILGLSSLNNLFVIPTAVYSILAMHEGYDNILHRKYKRYLMLIGGVVLVHGILLSANMFVFYFLSIIFATYLMEHRPKSNTFRLILVFVPIVLLGATILAMLLRYGIQYGYRNGEPWLSPSVLSMTLQYVLQAYIASDLNNAFIMMGSPSSLQMLSTSPSLASIFGGAFGVNFIGYEQAIPIWTSAYGTANVLGLWWFDWGWGALVISCFTGLYLGYVYRSSLVNDDSSLFVRVLYLVAYPGLFALSRVNYFGMDISILPNLFLAISVILAGLSPIRTRISYRDTYR